jgi:hypothetical protein
MTETLSSAAQRLCKPLDQWPNGICGNGNRLCMTGIRLNRWLQGGRFTVLKSGNGEGLRPVVGLPRQ